jgi:hypothetical protein
MEFSRCAPALVRPNENTAPRARSLKTQQCSYTEVDVLLGELETGRTNPSTTE